MRLSEAFLSAAKFVVRVDARSPFSHSVTDFHPEQIASGWRARNHR